MPFDTDLAETESWLAGQPDLKAVTGRVLTLTQLSGLSHGAVQVEAANGCFVLKRRRDAAAEDAEIELANTRSAAALGLAPEVCWAAPSGGTMLLRYLDGGRSFQGSPDEAAALGKVLARLHGSGAAFAGTLVAEDVWRALAAGLDAVPEDLEAAVDAALAQSPSGTSLVPSHGDLVPENILVCPGKAPVLIDWEYAAMADPAWDLAYVIGEAELGPRAEGALLESYRQEGGKVDPAALAAHKVLTSAVSALWALVQAAAGNPATDFMRYARLRVTRAVHAAKRL